MRKAMVVLALTVGGLLVIGGCDFLEEKHIEEPGEIVAGGDMRLPTDTWVVLAQFDITQPGTLVGDIRADGAVDVMGGFEHVATGELLGVASGGTPRYSTATVTAAHVAAGTAWRYIAVNSIDHAFDSSFTVRFEAD